MIQNCYDWDTDDETNFWHIIKSTYDFNDYSKKIKKYIEKANCKFEIRLVAKREIIEQGYDVLKSAIEGYRVSTTALPLKEKFVSYINSLDESYDIWGCIDRETHRIQAYSIVRKHSNWAEFLTSKVNPEFLPKYYPMYGLYDARNRYYLENLCFDFVDSGARTITEHSNIQDFLVQKMNFRKAYCHIKVHYAMWLDIIVKLLYPFRKMPILPLKVRNVLKLEEINRVVPPTKASSETESGRDTFLIYRHITPCLSGNNNEPYAANKVAIKLAA